MLGLWACAPRLLSALGSASCSLTPVWHGGLPHRFCQSTELLFERVEDAVVSRGGEVFETERQLKRCAGVGVGGLVWVGGWVWWCRAWGGGQAQTASRWTGA